MALPELTDTLVLAASIWRGLGSMEAALAMVERAAKRADPEDPLRLARVEHQWAKLLLQSGAPREAQAHLNQALLLYQRAGDGFNEVMALTLRVEVLKALGRGEAALTCARGALAVAEQRDWGVLAANLRLELGRILLERGALEQALDELRRALASLIVLGNRRLQLYAHARLWKTFTALGEEEAAAFELAQAAQLIGRADEKSEELDEVRRAVEAATPEPEPRPRPRMRRARSRETVN
jgi:tetratricopeptide (TPR) repeat protein